MGFYEGCYAASSSLYLGCGLLLFVCFGSQAVGVYSYDSVMILGEGAHGQGFGVQGFGPSSV